MLTQQYQENIATLEKKIEEAEVIVVGGAAGMTEAAGYSFYQSDDNFLKYFGKFADKYNIKNIFEGFYYPFSSKEERWAFLATDIKFIYEAKPGRPYFDLMQLLQGKDYFIVTTNQDAQFSKVFPKERVSPIQGDMRYFQCSHRCHDHVYFNKEQVEDMYANIEGTRIPTEMIPTCSKCEGDMEPWVRGYEFLEGSSYQNELRKYNEFIIKNKDKKILFLELGVGTMTPMFIKEPFWNMTYNFPNAYYITINPRDAVVPQELREKGLAIKEDIARVIQDAVNIKEKNEVDIG